MAAALVLGAVIFLYTIPSISGLGFLIIFCEEILAAKNLLNRVEKWCRIVVSYKKFREATE